MHLIQEQFKYFDMKKILFLAIILSWRFLGAQDQLILPETELRTDLLIAEPKLDSSDLKLNLYISLLPDTLKDDFKAMLDTLYNDTTVLFYPEPGDEIFDYWCNQEIHEKRFDFSYSLDTVSLILQDSNHKYVHPWKGPVTSRFGKRRYRWHYGTDVNLETGDSVLSAFDGKVRISRYSKTYGHVVVVRHENGLETLYAHLSKKLVDTNQVIKAGDCVGLGGNTGRSYGSHLHFEVRFLDEAINPEDIIDFKEGKLKIDTLLLNKSFYAYMDEVRELMKIKWHVIRRGDTLSHIAVRYGTTISNLCALNGIKRTTILRIGRRLRFR